MRERPLDRKKALKEKFNKKKNEQKKSNDIEIIKFEELNINFEPETYQWYDAVTGGVRKYE